MLVGASWSVEVAKKSSDATAAEDLADHRRSKTSISVADCTEDDPLRCAIGACVSHPLPSVSRVTPTSGHGEPSPQTAHTLYRFFDRRFRLIYVGITGRGTQRFIEHARDKAWYRSVTFIALEHFDAAEAAARAERTAIALERPRRNKSGSWHWSAVGATLITFVRAFFLLAAMSGLSLMSEGALRSAWSQASAGPRHAAALVGLTLLIAVVACEAFQRWRWPLSDVFTRDRWRWRGTTVALAVLTLSMSADPVGELAFFQSVARAIIGWTFLWVGASPMYRQMLIGSARELGLLKPRTGAILSPAEVVLDRLTSATPRVSQHESLDATHGGGFARTPHRR
jgi:predicted GIY-YIG superfamily endonuclease